jgi:predicted GIY-YIG superfamily endonuclease
MVQIPKRQCGDLKPSLIDLEVSDMTTGRKQVKAVQRERLSERDYMYCVYWICLPNHLDIYSEGYVGITSNFHERMRAHKKNKRKSHFTFAKNKYGWTNLNKTIVAQHLSLFEALLLERTFRPVINIGWNSQQGGELGVEPGWYLDQTNRDKHSKATSEATILAIAVKDTKEARSERAKKNWKDKSKSYEGICSGSKNSRAILKEEQVRYIKYSLIPAGLKDREISEKFGVKPYVISFIRSGKNWSHI